MAWTSPPTFSSGAVLTASQLNVLSQDLEHLAGYVSGQNPGMASIVTDFDGDSYGIIRHMHRYLHVVYLCQNDFRVAYSPDGATWTEVEHDGTPDGTVADSRIRDLNGFGFTVGALYHVKFTMDSGTVFYMYESDSAS